MIEAARFCRGTAAVGIPAATGTTPLPLSEAPRSLQQRLRPAFRGLVSGVHALRSVGCPAASCGSPQDHTSWCCIADPSPASLARRDVSNGATAKPLRGTAAVSGHAATLVALQAGEMHSSASLLDDDRGSGPTDQRAGEQQQQRQQQQQPPATSSATTTSNGSPGGERPPKFETRGCEAKTYLWCHSLGEAVTAELQCQLLLHAIFRLDD